MWKSFSKIWFKITQYFLYSNLVVYKFLFCFDLGYLVRLSCLLYVSDHELRILLCRISFFYLFLFLLIVCREKSHAQISIRVYQLDLFKIWLLYTYSSLCRSKTSCVKWRRWYFENTWRQNTVKTIHLRYVELQQNFYKLNKYLDWDDHKFDKHKKSIVLELKVTKIKGILRTQYGKKKSPNTCYGNTFLVSNQFIITILVIWLCLTGEFFEIKPFRQLFNSITIFTTKVLINYVTNKREQNSNWEVPSSIFTMMKSTTLLPFLHFHRFLSFFSFDNFFCCLFF